MQIAFDRLYAADGASSEKLKLLKSPLEQRDWVEASSSSDARSSGRYQINLKTGRR